MRDINLAELARLAEASKMRGRSVDATLPDRRAFMDYCVMHRDAIVAAVTRDADLCTGCGGDGTRCRPGWLANGGRGTKCCPDCSHRAVVTALPPMVNTMNELRELPPLSLIREVFRPSPSGQNYGAVWERRFQGPQWVCISGLDRSGVPTLPATVLYQPDDEAAR